VKTNVRLVGCIASRASYRDKCFSYAWRTCELYVVVFEDEYRDAFASRVAILGRKLREQKISMTEYINGVQSARAELVATIQARPPTPRVREAAVQSGSGESVQVAAAQTAPTIDPAATCMLMSSVIGVLTGVISHRTDTGLNSATAFLKGCTGQ
jgi:hypothetical protein